MPGQDIPYHDREPKAYGVGCRPPSPGLQKRIGLIPCIPIPKTLGTDINPIFEMALASYGFEASMRRDGDQRYILEIAYDFRPWKERYSPSLRARLDATRFLPTGPKPVTVEFQRTPGLQVRFGLSMYEANFGGVMNVLAHHGLHRK